MSNIIPVQGTPGLVLLEGDYIAVKPLCDTIGIEYSSQFRKIQDSGWANYCKIATVGADGKKREMFAIHKDSITGWLFTINAKRIKDETSRRNLLAYQKETNGAINAYYSKGIAVNTLNGQLDEVEVLERALATAKENKALRAQLKAQEPIITTQQHWNKEVEGEMCRRDMYRQIRAEYGLNEKVLRELMHSARHLAIKPRYNKAKEKYERVYEPSTMAIANGWAFVTANNKKHVEYKWKPAYYPVLVTLAEKYLEQKEG